MGFFRRKKQAVHVQVFGKTDTGQQRDHNEDSFLIADLSQRNASLQPEVREHDLGPKGTLFMVADGMGGAAAGEIASAMATTVVYEKLTQTWLTDDNNSPKQFVARLQQAVEAANERIHEHAREHVDHRGMGTTATCVGVLGKSVYLTQVGDSRAYLVRGGTATQITKDQSLMQRLIDAGELTEEEAENSERRNIILQALGPDAKIAADLTHHSIRRGDAVVVCSDGLSGLVKKEEIGEIIADEPKPSTACTRLVDLANERGGPDNITVVVAQFTGEALRKPTPSDDSGYRAYRPSQDERITQPVPAYDAAGTAHANDRLYMILVAVATALIIVIALVLTAR